ncbi:MULTISPECIES: hypothetical protein [unclassified Microbacterium]|uniref:phage tail tube protein n=1 Tax=unclassified Microbacterium TaxID=2609290 RepID=UPI0011C39FB7|nr:MULTISPECIES: hypothetical protein [unclassified Microbacterium]MBT2484858.1 hypothetical protein [Microbacterium sp. ISL-108]
MVPIPDKLINETDTVLLIPAHEVLGIPNAITPTGLVAYDALTTAVLNRYAPITSTGHANAGAGGNVSCAIVSDGFTLSFTDSQEDDEKTLCEPANSVDLTDFGFDNDMTGFRDANPAAADSVFALWKALTFAPDVPYIIVHRVGYASTVPFAVGQEIDVYYSHTDLPVNVHADGQKQKIQQVFISKSTAKPNYVLAA